MEKTTIQINTETLERLKSMKKYPRQSYEEIVVDLIDESEEGPLTKEELTDLQEALEEVKQGKTKPIEQVAKEMGITLS